MLFDGTVTLEQQDEFFTGSIELLTSMENSKVIIATFNGVTYTGVSYMDSADIGPDSSTYAGTISNDGTVVFADSYASAGEYSLKVEQDDLEFDTILSGSFTFTDNGEELGFGAFVDLDDDPADGKIMHLTFDSLEYDDSMWENGAKFVYANDIEEIQIYKPEGSDKYYIGTNNNGEVTHQITLKESKIGAIW